MTTAFAKSLEAGGELGEGDDKNPDIIPQQVASNTEEQPLEFVRKHRLQAVSTIDTSPSRTRRSLIEQGSVPQTSMSGHANYAGYCTIRSSMPLRELSALPSNKNKTVSIETKIIKFLKLGKHVKQQTEKQLLFFLFLFGFFRK